MHLNVSDGSDVHKEMNKNPHAVQIVLQRHLLVLHGTWERRPRVTAEGTGPRLPGKVGNAYHVMPTSGLRPCMLPAGSETPEPFGSLLAEGQQEMSSAGILNFPVELRSVDKGLLPNSPRPLLLPHLPYKRCSYLP